MTMFLDQIRIITTTTTTTTQNQQPHNSNDDIIPLPEQIALIRDHISQPPPFSTLDPVKNLNVNKYDRQISTSPQHVFGEKLSQGQQNTRVPLPTNKWYENLILMPNQQIEPSDENNAYTVPYFVKTNGPIAGIKLASTRRLGMEKVVQVTYVDHHSLTLGAALPFDYDSNSDSISNTGLDSNSNSGSGIGSGNHMNFENVMSKRYEVINDDINCNDNDQQHEHEHEHEHYNKYENVQKE
mmetsp:Transcript_13373/g.15583  ORF Transcript_13373/g.15583 Transcript_13373/m.15583 type:complete len:240 (+) Transcript_13373:563-1282(+)